MPEEIGLTLKYLENLKKTSYGSLEIFSGNWTGLESKGIQVNIITAWSGWGKVNAAYATTRLIAQSNRQKLDLDLIYIYRSGWRRRSRIKTMGCCRGYIFRSAIWMLGQFIKNMLFLDLNISKIETDMHLKKWALESLKKSAKKSFDPFKKIDSGLIATGDKFIDNKKEIEFFSKKL